MALPNFLIIGANKSGTTSLHNYLNQHPQIFMCPIKEPMYFIFAGKTLDMKLPQQEKVLTGAITSLSDYEQLFERGGNAIAIGESSTAYLANPWCAEFMHSTLPNAKLIAILRNPVERAFSNYRMYRRWGFEKRSFYSAIKEELDGKSDKLPQGQQYVFLGKYADSITNFFKIYGREKIQVLLYEHFLRNSTAVLKDICLFLGVGDDFNFDTTIRYDAEKRPERKRVMNNLFGRRQTLRTQEASLLRDYYRNDVESLKKLLGIDLSEWNI